MHVFMHMCMYACMHVCTCVHAHVRISWDNCRWFEAHLVCMVLTLCFLLLLLTLPIGTTSLINPNGHSAYPARKHKPHIITYAESNKVLHLDQSFYRSCKSVHCFSSAQKATVPEPQARRENHSQTHTRTQLDVSKLFREVLNVHNNTLIDAVVQRTFLCGRVFWRPFSH